MSKGSRPLVLVTGVGRRAGLGAPIALRLAADGWDVATTYWSPYDERVHGDHGHDGIRDDLTAAGARCLEVSADLEDPDTPATLFDTVTRELGPVSALVMAHCEGVNSDIMSTTVQSFDRHFAVNARASWLLVREFAARLDRNDRGDGDGTGRIVALTSDAVVGNLPYGASKGALDRIVLAAARELGPLGVTANVVNPGPIDTGWMSDDLRQDIAQLVPSGRLGRPSDTADLVSFLVSLQGGWINGQLLNSDGGLHA